MIRPLLAALALGLVVADAPPARATKSVPPPSLEAALERDLAILELRAHAASDRLAELDVGVHPLPQPRRWRR